jgi:hypothetical protein
MGVITDPVAAPTTSSVTLLRFSVILDKFLTLFNQIAKEQIRINLGRILNDHIN